MIKTVYLKNSYTFYRKHYGVGIGDLDYRDGLPIYMQIVTGFFKFLMKKVFDGFDVRLGAKLGVIAIRGEKQEPYINEDGNICGLKVDWGETNKLWASNPEAKEKKTLAYHFNEHTNGIGYSLCWFKKNVIIRNKSMYGLEFSRNNTRTIARKVIDEQMEYLIVENNKK